MTPHLGPEIHYRNGLLAMEGVDLSALADDPAVQTPAYVYSAGLLRRRFGDFRAAIAETLALAPQDLDQVASVCFAVKALSNQAVLHLLKAEGAGADLVTRGELERALRAGFDPGRIVYSGLGKSQDDLDRALHAGVQINVESLSELYLAQDRAAAQGRRGRVAFRLNPQLDAMRAELGAITTGKPDSKFGIGWAQLRDLLPAFAGRFPDLDLVGASVHIGSNLDVRSADSGDARDFRTSFTFLAETVLSALEAAGAKAPVRLDLGGGLGIDYEQEPAPAPGASPCPNPSLAAYAALVGQIFRPLVAAGRVHLIFEPGRVLCAEAGLLVSRILHVKEETVPEGRPFSARFVILDAGLNDLKRPGLYGAYHPIVPVRQLPADRGNVDICGAVCETTDSFMRPTREWLRRYDNVLSRAEAGTEMGGRLYGAGYGEVAPAFAETGERRTYDYFVKRRFPAALTRGDLVAVLNAGAYGAVMASEYNSRPLIPEILVDGDRHWVIRPRPAVEDLIGRDQVPETLAR